MDAPHLHPPLLRLPFEVISSILLWYKYLHHSVSVSDDVYSEPYHDDIDPSRKLPAPDHAAIRALLLLGSISKSLRAAAWSTPLLWTHISLTLHRTRLSAEIVGLHAWLARAGACPLHIRLQCGEADPGWAKYPPLEAVEVISKHCKQWEELCLVLPPTCLAQVAERCEEAGTVGMPMLRKLTLLVRRQWWGAEKPSFKAFSGAARLVDVDLFGIPLDSVDLPWTQLTRFRGHPLDAEEIMEALSLGPNLESCTIACTHTDSYNFPSSPFNHTNLHNLKLTGTITPLKHLTLPALRTLAIECPEGGFNGHHFVHLMQRSGAMLRCLHLTIDCIPSVSLLECLAATPALEELTVCNLKDRVHSVFGDSVVERLTFKPESPSTVPQLRRLEVLNCSCHFDAGKLEEMLWSRWNPGRSVCHRTSLACPRAL
ncbi:hypothetical protein LshimejAT787_1202730 [Lyophyllum shimeji]|uniref:F-box domain-containing protein n=1 Tax=Lyophyllum shimeji TaxID=47721 RepID=A0A9P3PWK8_LYOSH|nr:hypothetical protein LshimejAT787_1202730 [Lyophyllum shimeji]